MIIFAYRLSLVFTLLLTLVACSGSPKLEPLMPTPLLFEFTNKGPLDHIPEEEQWNLRRVYYATTRVRSANLRSIDYTNEESDSVSVGMTLIGFGDEDLIWSDLALMSKQTERSEPIPLSVAGILEAGKYKFTESGDVTSVRGASSWLVANLNESIESSRDKDVLIYVHGAKVDFYNASAFAAQLDHFMGRDMTAIAFSWPTRQNIAAYASGGDVKRAYNSAPALATVVELLAKKTKARHINILTWSAGGRLVTEALSILYARHPEKTPEQLREFYRLGTVYYAAADVPRDEFITALPKINAMVERVVVTGSANDGALRSAKMFMGGSARIGQIEHDSLNAEQIEIVNQADRLEYIDLSQGSASRGFDITGHRYWFNHPWASTDTILTIRTDLGPAERGLEHGDHPALWWMPDDYPTRLKELLKTLNRDNLRKTE